MRRAGLIWAWFTACTIPSPEIHFWFLRLGSSKPTGLVFLPSFPFLSPIQSSISLRSDYYTLFSSPQTQLISPLVSPSLALTLFYITYQSLF
ncbi:hypothetical protein HD806DRAFT_497322 [Xylariaceae sp. AK1471]|nr:hypothetical protein HD806DRAFT_497322 [Xylariaceae sp. AK1471]